MNKNKILICLYIPLIEKKYDLYIPINKKVGTIKKLIEEGLLEITENDYVISPETNFYSKDTGQVYDVNQTVKDTDLKNGSRIILVYEVLMTEYAQYVDAVNKIYSYLEMMKTVWTDQDNISYLDNLETYKQVVINNANIFDPNKKASNGMEELGND